MNSVLPSSGTTNLLSTSWDVVDHYLLAAMLAVSVASFGLQTTKDHLICIPAVKCSSVAENNSNFGNGNGSSDVLKVCKKLSLQSTSQTVVLTTMSDRRQYDYVDNECYFKMHCFARNYSLLFLAETVILLAISNFWKKYPNTRCALAHCEHLLSEFNKGQFEPSSSLPNRDQSSVPNRDQSSVPNRDQSSVPNREQSSVPNRDQSSVPNRDQSSVPNRDQSSVPNRDQSSTSVPNRDQSSVPNREQSSVPNRDQSNEQFVSSTSTTSDHNNLICKLSIFEKRYSQPIPKKKGAKDPYRSVSSVTVQYLLRGGIGSLVTVVCLTLNAVFFCKHSTSLTHCCLENVSFVTEHSLFRCSRSTQGYFEIVSISFFVFLSFHLLIVAWAFVWTCFGAWKSRPEFTETDWFINPRTGEVFKFFGDAAFLFRMMNVSNTTLLKTVVAQKTEERMQREGGNNEDGSDNTSHSPFIA
ncbi:volume-regulated anion channel subunit LRRC8A-like [Montipora capricornis]|uniref:volume-regulated anion channel subunit LRRC8A-like n=1 Tax=Montipora capricornis TaxID=246305 RepID=UPI0035F1A998